MRVLFVTNLYPPHHLGGMELRCGETVNSLQARGHDCHVLTSRHGLEGEPLLEEGVTRALHLQADIYHYRPLDFFVRRPRQESANLHALRRAIELFQPDVIFVWSLWLLSRQVPFWAEQWLPGRVAYAVAGYYLSEPDAHEAFWQPRPVRTWRDAVLAPARWAALRIVARDRKAHILALEHVACVSEYVRRKLSDAGVLPHGARVIYNGIDPRPFVEAEARRLPHYGSLRLVYTGGLAEHKGVHTAIEAVGLLRQYGETRDVSLTLVGGGHPDYEAYLRQRVGSLGLEEHVTFFGRVPREDIAGILADHDVFLFTSTYDEPIARSVMEAMATGLAVIGTPVGGQAEMLEDGVNALVYPVDDALALAECILRLKSDPQLRTGLANEGRRTVLARFTLDRMVDEMEAWLMGIAS